MAARSVPRREALARDDKGCRVRTCVEQELPDDVERKHRALAQVFKPESQDAEYDGQKQETKDLKRLAAHSVDGEDCRPVSRDRASAG